MSIPLPDGRTALRTVLVERTSGREHVLLEREGKQCHFAFDYPHGDFTINLRVDWSDLVDDDPTLDADIYRIDADGRRTRITNGKWHHTRLESASLDEVRCYAFVFQDLTLHLIARKSLAVTTCLDAYIVASDSKRDDAA